MNNIDINEGSIDVKLKVKQLMVVIKRVLRGMYDSKVIVGGRLVGGDKFKETLDILNRGIEEGILKDKIDIGCGIYFVNDESKRDSDGWYNRNERNIYVDAYEALLYGEGVDAYKRYYEIQFNEISRILEHELVHHEQNVRSSGKFFTANKKTRFMTKDEYEQLRKKFNIDGMNVSERNHFIKILVYMNDTSELDTFANNVADKYVEYMLKGFKMMVKNRIKSDNSVRREYSAEEVRRYVLSPIYGAKEGNDGDYFNLRFLKKKLIGYYTGYTLLTDRNKRKWWGYVIKALLNHKFESMSF
jgi:hypothetical protein